VKRSNAAFVALLALLGVVFVGLVLKASLSWFFWNSAVQAMGFWRWVYHYKLDDLAILLLSLSLAYALLRYLERKVGVDGR